MLLDPSGERGASDLEEADELVDELDARLRLDEPLHDEASLAVRAGHVVDGLRDDVIAVYARQACGFGDLLERVLVLEDPVDVGRGIAEGLVEEGDPTTQVAELVAKLQGDRDEVVAGPGVVDDCDQDRGRVRSSESEVACLMARKRSARARSIAPTVKVSASGTVVKGV